MLDTSTSLGARAPQLSSLGSQGKVRVGQRGGDGPTIMDGATILPCRARRMPKNHNEKVRSPFLCFRKAFSANRLRGITQTA